MVYEHNEKVSLIFRLKRLIGYESTTISLLLAACGFMLGLGFLLCEATNSNYAALSLFGSQFIWGIGFIFYGVLKFAQALFRMLSIVKMLAYMLGLWSWNYILLSFTVFDPTPIAPTEILLALPLICEVWGLTYEMYISKLPFFNRRTKDKTCQ